MRTPTANASGCVGGGSIGECVEGQGGPKCKVCLRAGDYYDEADSKCKECPEAGDASARVTGVVLAIAAVITIVRVVFLFPGRIPAVLRPAADAILRLVRWLVAMGLQAKLKVRCCPAHTAREPRILQLRAVPLRRSSSPSTR